MDTARLDALLAAARRMGASALHLVPGRPPALRVQRRFVAGDEDAVRGEEVEELLRDMLFSDHRAQLAQVGFVEVLYVARSGRRYHATVAGESSARSLLLRPVPAEVAELEDLHMPEQVESFTRCRQGFVAVAGFFGAGKSTTLAGLVEACNRDSSRHVMTIEDHIHVVHDNGAALLHQRQVGTHVRTAADGIRQGLLAGADVIVVSAVRDQQTMAAALQAAESGCLVFGGVEAGSVAGALADLSAMAPVEDRDRWRARLSRSLRGVVAQSLLPRSRQAGRVPVVEILVSSRPVREAIRSGAFEQVEPIMQRCRGLGMQSFDTGLRELMNRHLVSEEDALLYASNRDQLRSRVSR